MHYQIQIMELKKLENSPVNYCSLFRVFLLDLSLTENCKDILR